MLSRELFILTRYCAHTFRWRRGRSVRRQELKRVVRPAIAEELGFDLARKNLGEQRWYGVADLALHRRSRSVHLHVVGNVCRRHSRDPSGPTVLELQAGLGDGIADQTTEPFAACAIGCTCGIFRGSRISCSAARAWSFSATVISGIGRRRRERLDKLARGANAPYWTAKIAANAARDRRTTRLLRVAGWTVVRLWETDVLRDVRRAARRVEEAVSSKSSAKPDARLRGE